MGRNPRYFIEICGQTWEVRQRQHHREIKSRGVWITHDEFIRRLQEARNWDVLCELAKLGFPRTRPLNASDL